MRTHNFTSKPTKSSFHTRHKQHKHDNPSCLLHNLTSFLLLILTIINCLDLTATITRSTPFPILRGKLVDNSKFVCGINLSTKFGSRLPWNCLPGYKAWSTPDGGQLVFTNEGGQKFTLGGASGGIKKSLQADKGTLQNQMTVLRGRWFGCRLEDPWTPSVTLKRSRVWRGRDRGVVEEDPEIAPTSTISIDLPPEYEAEPAELADD